MRMAIAQGPGPTPTTTDGAMHVVTQAGSVWSYGNWPATWWLAIESTAPDTGDGTVVYESPDVSNYNRHEFAVIAGTAGALALTVSYDGINYSPSTAIMVVDRSIATGEAAGQITNFAAAGNYYVNGKFKKFRIIQSGGSISAAYQVRGAHSVT